MAIVKKYTDADNGKEYITLYDREFKTTKSGKAVYINDVSFCFPASFLKEAKSGKSKFVNIRADELAKFICIAKDEPETSAAASESVK
jgi:hypothetical protein